MDITEKYADGFTNKQDSREHGVVLLNVGDIVRGYNGVLNREAANSDKETVL